MTQKRTAQEEPLEHLRYAAYLLSLEQVSAEQELTLVTAVLTDPDRTMAASAVVQHMQRRVLELLRSPAYPAWQEGMADALAGHTFLAKRLDEWALFRAVTLDLPWTPEELITASDWLQCWISQGLRSSAEAHTVLADSGRTRRVRNAAKSKIKNRPH